MMALRSLVRLFRALTRKRAARDKADFIARHFPSFDIRHDTFGRPIIQAACRPDAFRMLGFVTALDRFFQMDVLRRSATGRLSELFGAPALQLDRRRRVYGFAHIAKEVVARLSGEQASILEQYTEGINLWHSSDDAPPFECDLIGYAPEPWRAEDSIAILLLMFDELGTTEATKRCLTVMNAALSPAIVSFFTETSDDYETYLDGSARPAMLQSIPKDALAALLAERKARPWPAASVVPASSLSKGSNAWTVSGRLTGDGRAILANDMHLPLSIPNVTTVAALYFGREFEIGAHIPGLPVTLTGSNGSLAWGLTNLHADNLDLIKLELHPQDSCLYATADGFRRFAERSEKIKVRGGPDQELTVRRTIWGPVSETLLLGSPCALRWAACDVNAVDLGFSAMGRAKTLAQGFAATQSGMPPLSVHIATASGQIGWSVGGRVIKRNGGERIACLPSSAVPVTGLNYLDGETQPRFADPPAGHLQSANNRLLANTGPCRIGENFASGFRASKIASLLKSRTASTEVQNHAIQLNVDLDFYDFYRDLIQALHHKLVADRGAASARNLRLFDERGVLKQGTIRVVKRFRQLIIDSVHTAFLAPCSAADVTFTFEWLNLEPPIRLLLSDRDDRIFPFKTEFNGWQDFLIAALDKAVALEGSSLRQALRGTGVESLVRLRHPLSSALPVLSRLLDMPAVQLGGDQNTVRVHEQNVSAVVRLVVSPGHEEDGILYTPCGQSGSPDSIHYRDQHRVWARGGSIGFPVDRSGR